MTSVSLILPNVRARSHMLINSNNQREFTGPGYAIGNDSFVSYGIEAMYVCISGHPFHSPFLHYLFSALTPERRLSSFRTILLGRITIKSLVP
jgi:hypothetical protein